MRHSKRPDPSMEEVLEATPGRYYYRDHLVLIVARDGWHRKWVYRYKSPRTGRWTETTLFSALAFTAEEARHKIKFLGADPVHDNRQAKARIKTFGEVATSWITTKQLSGHRHYTATLYLHKHCADLHDKQMSFIDADAVQSALKLQIQEHPRQARRVLSMLEILFQYAIAQKYYSGQNPAQWKGLHETWWPRLPKGSNHAGMPFMELPDFMKELRLRQNNSTSAVALELLILTACRTKEILELRWSEIDWKQQVLVLPPERMKPRKQHRIPATARMLEILQEQERSWSGGNFVFTGYSQAALAEKTLLKFLRDGMGVKGYTVAGFRSTFSDWAYEMTGFDPFLIELSLSHSWGNKVTRAYFRGDALEKRRPLMECWSKYCEGPSTSELPVPLIKVSVA